MMTSRLTLCLFLGLAAAALAGLLGMLQLVRSFEAMTIDWRFLFRGSQPPSTEIVLVLVDEETAKGLPYRSPLPRRHLAAVIEALHRSGARLIGVDVFFADRSADVEGDSLLVRAVGDAGNVVLVSAMETDQTTGKRMERQANLFFRERAFDVGYSDLPLGPLEIIREGRLLTFIDGKPSLSFALTLYSRLVGLETGRLREGEVSGTFLSRWADQAYTIPVDYTGPPSVTGRDDGNFRVYSSGMVASGFLPVEWFREKIVLIGTGLDDAPDRFRTPFFSRRYDYRRAFGVEIHAGILQTLLSGVPVHHAGRLVAVGLVVGIALLISLVTVLRGTTTGGMLTGGGILIIWVGSFVFFQRTGTLLPVILPSVAGLTSYLFAVVAVAMTEGRQKRQIRGFFEKYIEPSLVQEMLRHPETWDLGGKEAVLTMLFSDLEGFTTISESMPPREVVKLLNEYLDEMSRIIFQYGGTIDKYEGDLIMAIFGAPLPQPDHAVRACLAALAMQERLVELRERWKREGRPLLKARIGINTGLVIVGNMGSSIRFDYTVIGDNANLASRLEGENKQYGTYMMISESTYEAAKEAVEVRYLGEVVVKGKTVPVKVYEVTGRKDNI